MYIMSILQLPIYKLMLHPFKHSWSSFVVRESAYMRDEIFSKCVMKNGVLTWLVLFNHLVMVRLWPVG